MLLKITENFTTSNMNYYVSFCVSVGRLIYVSKSFLHLLCFTGSLFANLDKVFFTTHKDLNRQTPDVLNH